MRTFLLILAGLLLSPALLVAQSIADYPFLDRFQNKIIRSECLEPLFASLPWAGSVDTSRINIVHLGDSHVKSGCFGEEVRDLLVTEFGPRVFYQVNGTNGASYRDYTQKSLPVLRYPDIRPDLFIISLGTNEAQDTRFSEARFSAEMAYLIHKLRRDYPSAEILLTTPMDSYRRRYSPNLVVKQVRDAILKYAESQDLPVWDLYAVAGGEKVAAKWKSHRLMAADGIHFTQEGYRLQGRLLHEALMKTALHPRLSAVEWFAQHDPYEPANHVQRK